LIGYGEFENSRFFDMASLEAMYPRRERDERAVAKWKEELAAKQLWVDRDQWKAAARAGLKVGVFDTPARALTCWDTWKRVLHWEDHGTVTVAVHDRTLTLSTVRPASALLAQFPEGPSPRWMPVLFSRERHSQELLVGSEFLAIQDAPDALLQQLLTEEMPFALHYFPDGLTLWRKRGDTLASFTIFFDKALETTPARKRTDLTLSLLFTPSFLFPQASVPITSANTLQGDAFNRYPIQKLRKRFKDAMEALGTACLNALEKVESQGARRRGKSLPRRESPHPGRLDLPHQIQVEAQRYLFRLLFLFSAEAKGLISSRLLPQRGGSTVYSTQFLRRAAAQMRMSRHPQRFERSYFLWDSFHELFALCREGVKTKLIEIPPFDGQLFDPCRLPLLASGKIKIPDAAMAKVIDAISRVPVRRGAGIWEYCNFKTLQVNHLGEIYQWLLEFEPKVLKGAYGKVQAKEKDEPFYLTQQEKTALQIPSSHWKEVAANNAFTFRINPKSTVRSQTGTHFTQAALGQRIAQEALDDILRPLEEKGDPEAILSLSVVEPCLGSAGIAAEAVGILARSLYLASLTPAERKKARENPKVIPAPALQLLKRRVVERNVYGVDKSIDAVELARAALWQECASPKLPLPFLGHKLRCGDALVGTWFLTREAGTRPRWALPGRRPLDLLAKEKDLARHFADAAGHFKDLAESWNDAIPNGREVEAWRQQIEKELRAVKRAREKFLKETGKPEEVRQQEGAFAQLLDWVPEFPSDALSLHEKKDREFVRDILRLSPYRRLRLLGDLATSLYFWPVEAYRSYPSPAIYQEIVRCLLAPGNAPLSPQAVRSLKTAMMVGYRRAFFHWEVEFPELFLDGAKPDICLSNPPWDKPHVDEASFWAQHHPLAGKKGFGTDKVARIVRKLDSSIEYEKQQLDDKRYSYFLKQSGDYHTLEGTLDLYRPFIEQLGRLCHKRGVLLLPQSFWIYGNAEAVRRLAKDTLGWDRLVGFVNHGKRFFSNVHASYSFAICRFTPNRKSPQLGAVFRLRSVDELEALESDKLAYFPGEKREFLTFDWAAVAKLAPDLALPEASTQMDVSILQSLVTTNVRAKSWLPDGVRTLDFYLTTDLAKKKIIPRESATGDYSDLWRGGHFHVLKPYFQQEDPAHGFVKGKTKYAPLPENRKTAPYTSLVAKKSAVEALGDIKRWRIAWRCVASSTNARTLVLSLVPPGVVCGHSAYVATSGKDLQETLVRAGVLASLVADSVVRPYTAVNVTLSQVRRIPVPNVDLEQPLYRRLGAFVASLHSQVIEAHGRWEMETAGRKLDAKSYDEAKALLQEDRGAVANHVNALVAVAYTLATDGAFTKAHFAHLMDAQFSSLFQRSQQAPDNEPDPDSDEGTDRGTPDALNKDHILALYDQYYARYAAKKGAAR
jgi:hypothetical protein